MLQMLSDPHTGSKFRETLDSEIGESGKNRGQIVAYYLNY
jgi:hypothetical protein